MVKQRPYEIVEDYIKRKRDVKERIEKLNKERLKIINVRRNKDKSR